MDLEDIMPSEMSHHSHTNAVRVHQCDIPRSQVHRNRKWARWGAGTECVMGTVSTWEDGKFWGCSGDVHHNVNVLNAAELTLKMGKMFNFMFHIFSHTHTHTTLTGRYGLAPWISSLRGQTLIKQPHVYIRTHTRALVSLHCI